MSKVVALGEPEELVALLAAGIDVRPCPSAEELADQLETLTSRREARLVLVTEQVAELDAEAVEEARRLHRLVVLVVPTLKGQRRVSERALSRLLEEAAGADLLAREAEEASQGEADGAPMPI